MMKATHVVAVLSGGLFALGLGISGMTQPTRVIGFLDVFGDWNPSLGFVMLGAIGVHVMFAQRARRPGARPWLAERSALPTNTRIDRRLLVGSGLFGLGWGTAGFCPGPAVVSLVALSPDTWLFVGAMLFGMWLHALTLGRADAKRVEVEPRNHRTDASSARSACIAHPRSKGGRTQTINGV